MVYYIKGVPKLDGQTGTVKSALNNNINFSNEHV